MSQLYDVAVIGAGPAGSATAYELAGRGFKVALLDRAAFPREKACGDLLSPSAVVALHRLGLDSLVEAHRPEPEWPLLLDLMGHPIPYRVRTRWAGERVKWMAIRRAEMDAALVQHACQAGAALYERTAVSHSTATDGVVEVNAQGVNSGKLAARLVVVAAGSGAPFAQGKARFFAVRGYYRGAPGEPMALRWSEDVLPGYAWQFPTTAPDIYNVGIYTHHDKARQMGLLRQLEQLSLTQEKERTGPLKGGLVNISFSTGSMAAHADRRLWVGDAAGLVQPHLGEGIGPALRSAAIAAQVAESALGDGDLSARALAAYTRRLHDEFDRELRFSRLFYWLARHPRAFRLSARFLRRFYSLAHRSIVGAPPPSNAALETPDELLA